MNQSPEATPQRRQPAGGKRSSPGLSRWSSRWFVAVLFLPPLMAVVMGVVLMTLATRVDTTRVATEATPLSKTSWRTEHKEATK
ncbi:MAG: hypothetical protein AAF648_16860 [Pseudomonadota bacterium]